MEEARDRVVKMNPRINLGVTVTLMGPPKVFVIPEEDFPVDIQEEASLHFQNIYAEVLTLEDAVRLLTRFSKSRKPREKRIFACMVNTLFDDYKFFPRDLRSDLKITSVLFGSLIKYDMLSVRAEKNAKTFIYEALLHPVDTKTFLLGVLTVEQIMSTLLEWCSSSPFLYGILKYTRLQQGRGDIVESILRAVAKNRSSISGYLLWKTDEFIAEHKAVSWTYTKIIDYLLDGS